LEKESELLAKKKIKTETFAKEGKDIQATNMGNAIQEEAKINITSINVNNERIEEVLENKIQIESENPNISTHIESVTIESIQIKQNENANKDSMQEELP